jgi:hypothetical protein
VEKLVETNILQRPSGHSHSIYIKADGTKKFANDAYTLDKDGTFKYHKAGGKKKTGGAKKKKKTKGKSRAKKTAEESSAAEESAGEAVAA